MHEETSWALTGAVSSFRVTGWELQVGCRQQTAEGAHSLHQGANPGAGGRVCPPQLSNATAALRDCCQLGPDWETSRWTRLSSCSPSHLHYLANWDANAMLGKQSEEVCTGGLPSLCCSSRCGCETGLSGFRCSRPVVFCLFRFFPLRTLPVRRLEGSAVSQVISFPADSCKLVPTLRKKNSGTWNKSATRDTEASTLVTSVGVTRRGQQKEAEGGEKKIKDDDALHSVDGNSVAPVYCQWLL